MTERNAALSQATGSRRNPLAPRHPLVGHDVQRPATDTRLARLLSRVPARYTVSEDRLQPEHRRLRQRSLMIARLALPSRSTDPTDAAEVLIPRQPGAGGVAVPLDLRIA